MDILNNCSRVNVWDERSHDGADTERNRHTKGHAQITKSQPESQTADSPKHTEKIAEATRFRIG